MTGQEFLMLTIEISLWMVMAGVVCAFVRLALGPTLPDRVIALDMMTILIVAFCGLYAMLTGEAAFLDVAIVMALVGFLATVAFARFVDRRVSRARQPDGNGDAPGEPEPVDPDTPTKEGTP